MSWAVYARAAHGGHERGEIVSVHRTYELAERRLPKDGQAGDGFYALAEVDQDARKGMRYTDQGAVPMRGPGRPIEGQERRQRYNVMLEPRLKEMAEMIGGGNFSAGVARALEAFSDNSGEEQ